MNNSIELKRLALVIPNAQAQLNQDNKSGHKLETIREKKIGMEN